jgi:hypothetical protein
MWYIFPRVIQLNTKLANFEWLYFAHFTTFRNQTLQFYYCNFNIFLAVVMDFVLFAEIKIYSLYIAGIIYWLIQLRLSSEVCYTQLQNLGAIMSLLLKGDMTRIFLLSHLKE